MTKEIIPNKDKRNKKKSAFKKDASKYFIENNNLYYQYNTRKGIEKRRIPFKEEVPILLNYLHITNNHAKSEEMINLINDLKYYLLGFTNDTNDIIQTINKCVICFPERKGKKIKLPSHIIISNGPHYRYQADIWELHHDLKNICKFKYVLDIIDHFSKWSWSYFIEAKEFKYIIQYIRRFILAFGKPVIFQTDSGLEFDTFELRAYMRNNGIIYIKGRPYHPQSIGCCERHHKLMQSYMINEFIEEGKDYDI